MGPYTETECSSQQKTDCESRWEEDGYGGKKWVEVPSTCQQNTYDTCQDVQKQKLVQVPYTDCQNVPQQQCTKVPQQQCQQEPYTASQQLLRRRPPQDPSESESDSAKEDVRRRWKQRSLSSVEADWWQQWRRIQVGLNEQ